jgi:hypothetical protein
VLAAQKMLRNGAATVRERWILRGTALYRSWVLRKRRNGAATVRERLYLARCRSLTFAALCRGRASTRFSSLGGERSSGHGEIGAGGSVAHFIIGANRPPAMERSAWRSHPWTIRRHLPRARGPRRIRKVGWPPGSGTLRRASGRCRSDGSGRYRTGTTWCRTPRASCRSDK